VTAMALPDGVALPKVQVPGTGDQRFVVVARVEEASSRCLEVREHCLGQLLSSDKPLGIKGSLVKLQQAVDQVGIVLQVVATLGLALALDPQYG
jgi:hypothetical protein